MLSQLDSLKTEALAAIDAAQDESALEAVRVNFLGKKGSVTALSAGHEGRAR
jgi:phenylalanyl-tRNA synthetase alpha chain